MVSSDAYRPTQCKGAYTGWDSAITVKVQVDEVPLDMDTAIPCGLIIKELVSNALKHAFPLKGTG
jgi:two-component sensor histidine kinase